MIIFGVAKTALFPFHSWLPSAMVAPAPVSALLHAVAVVKSGIFVVMKIFIFIFGVDYLHAFSKNYPFAQSILIVISCFTILYASMYAIYQVKIKKMLAFSTISQLAYSVLALSLFSKAGVFASFMHMMIHAFAKIVLFFCAGLVYTSTGVTNIVETRSISQYFPSVMKCFGLCAFVLIGLPPLGGFFTKFMILSAASNHQLFWLMASTIILSTLMTAVYFVKLIYNIYYNPSEQANKRFPVPRTMEYTIIFITCLLLLLPFIIEYLRQYLS
jgi:formate hydrogenlyase subunit 3/multisubunit Na+/H+ antiporter MnhD subunit